MYPRRCSAVDLPVVRSQHNDLALYLLPETCPIRRRARRCFWSVHHGWQLDVQPFYRTAIPSATLLAEVYADDDDALRISFRRRFPVSAVRESGGKLASCGGVYRKIREHCWPRRRCQAGKCVDGNNKLLQRHELKPKIDVGSAN